jgi:hypothetical protein
LAGSGRHSPEYRELIKYVKEENQSPDFATEVYKKMDVDQYYNYTILEIFNANPDSRGNIKFWKTKNADNRWHWIFYDGDCSCGVQFVRRENFLSDRLSPVETVWYNPESTTILLRSLTANPLLRDRFINQYCLLLSTVLSADSLVQRVNDFKAIYEPEIPRHVKRRDYARGESVHSWNSQIRTFIYFYERMPAKAYEQLKAQFDLGDTVRISVSTNVPGLRTLKLNHSGLRFDKVEGLFFDGLPLEVEATGDDHRYRFVKWVEDEDTSRSRTLKIREGMRYTAEYVPKDTSGLAGTFLISRFYVSSQTKKDLRWLEIRNIGNREREMDGLTIYEDVEQWSCAFNSMEIPAGGSVVISNDTAHFRELNPDYPGILIQSGIGIVFHQDYRFVLCDKNDLLVDQFLLKFPDSLLLKRNHFLAVRTIDGPLYDAWNNDKKTIDWTEKVCPECESVTSTTNIWWWIGGILVFAGLLVILFFMNRRKKWIKWPVLFRILVIIGALYPLIGTAQEESQINVGLCGGYDRFQLDSAQIKLVDNRGTGPDSMQGVRNFRVVLHNILYRGGGDNIFRKKEDSRHYMQNPLPLHGIENLHKAGFTKAIYLYYTNFESRYPPERRDSLLSEGFEYVLQTDIIRSQLKEFFEDILSRVEDPEKGAVYAHCWNGWHMSGWLAALTLMQFCGLDNEQAVRYWEENTDGHSHPYRKLKEHIRKFEPYSGIGLSDTQRREFCPCFSERVLNGTPDGPEDGTQENENTGHVYHTVVKGNTLYGIAREYGVSLKSILKLNDLDEEDTIYPGQKIRGR